MPPSGSGVIERNVQTCRVGMDATQMEMTRWLSFPSCRNFLADTTSTAILPWFKVTMCTCRVHRSTRRRHPPAFSCVGHVKHRPCKLVQPAEHLHYDHFHCERFAYLFIVCVHGRCIFPIFSSFMPKSATIRLPRYRRLWVHIKSTSSKIIDPACALLAGSWIK